MGVAVIYTATVIVGLLSYTGTKFHNLKLEAPQDKASELDAPVSQGEPEPQKDKTSADKEGAGTCNPHPEGVQEPQPGAAAPIEVELQPVRAEGEEPREGR